MANAEMIANLTHHQNITDAMLTSMGECMALQQALLHVPNYNGKNMPLKAFIQDVENGHTFVPDGLRNAFFKGVCSKLKETAHDAVADKEINSIEDLSDALTEFFSPKKSYAFYCAEMQGIRLRHDETVLNYYTRIQQMRTCAMAALKEKFTEAQSNQMLPILDGLALESFKRGLPADLLYAISVQDPQTLEEAFRIVQRIERDMQGTIARNSNSLRFPQTQPVYQNPQDVESRHVSFYPRENRDSYDKNSNFQDNFQPNFVSPQVCRTFEKHLDHSQQQSFIKRPPHSNFSNFPQNDSYVPQAYPYMPYIPPMYSPWPNYPSNYYPPSCPIYRNQLHKDEIYSYEELDETKTTSFRPINSSENLNLSTARRMDASSSEQQTQHRAIVKFLTVDDLLRGPKDKDDLQIELVPQETVPFDYYESEEDFFDRDTDENTHKTCVETVKSTQESLRVDHLNTEKRQHVLDLVNDFSHLFHFPGDKLPATSEIRHSIHRTDELPMTVRHYRDSLVNKEEINEQLKKLIENNIIEDSISPYNSPLRIVPKKTEAVDKFTIPRTVTNIRQFLGLAGYYRRFTEKFSGQAKLLIDLLKRCVEFKRGPEQQKSFDYLKTALCSTQILQYPNFKERFALMIDALNYEIGAVLSQGKISEHKPIAYMSRIFNPAKNNYGTTEKECLLYSILHFKPYLYGRHFTVVSDHKPLRWIDSLKLPIQRLIRWRIRLLKNEYTFEYKPR